MHWGKDKRKKTGGFWFCAVKRRESKRQWRKANLDKERERERRYRAANHERIRENNLRWRVKNRETVLEKDRLRARQKYSQLTWQEKYVKGRYKYLLYDRPKELQVQRERILEQLQQLEEGTSYD